MKLSEAQENKNFIIEKIQGDKHFEERVSAMGLRKGIPLMVIKNRKKLPLLIYARDTMIAIGRNESEKILIGDEKIGK